MKMVEIIYIPIFLITSIIYFTVAVSSFAISIFFLVAGSFILVKGSDFFVDGAVNISTKIGVSEHTIGLTIVALGTSLPELAISVLASYHNHTETAWGNVIGSNVTNLLLILGFAMIVMHIKPSRFAIKDSISMLLISFLTIFLAIDGALQFYDGFLLIFLYVTFIYMLKNRKAEKKMEKTHGKNTSLFLLIGVVGVGIGGETVVNGAVNIAKYLGVKEIAIAASMVALGTSLPELITSIVAAIKKHHGIAVGNVIGSNLVNLCMVLGLSAVVRGIPINLHSIVIIFFLLTALITPVILKKKWISRVTGITFLILYVLFLLCIYMIG
ncbi:MAG TPA: sodium:calcium antiporter [Thermoplasmata archaeon]|nr:sodium:calcium antiporter [Thermoplasmata archaeon]